MKRFLLTLIFVLVGSGLWWLLSTTHDASIKKWDANFGHALEHNLNNLGFRNEDVLASMNILKKDKKGEWVTKQLTLKMPSKEKIASLKKELEDSGAQVEEAIVDGNQALLVKRGNRIYQQIQFQK